MIVIMRMRYLCALYADIRHSLEIFSYFYLFGHQIKLSFSICDAFRYSFWQIFFGRIENGQSPHPPLEENAPQASHQTKKLSKNRKNPNWISNGEQCSILLSTFDWHLTPRSISNSYCPNIHRSFPFHLL